MSRNQTDRIIYNGNDLSKIVCCKVRRPIMADVEIKSEQVPGRHGEIFKSARRSGYDLPVEMWLRTSDRRDVAELRHRLAAALWSDEPAPLYLPDDPTKYLLAIVSGSTDLDEITDDCPCATVTFRVCDPDYFGEHRRIDVRSGSVCFDAGGSRPAHLCITAKPGSCSSWRVTNRDTGEFINVTGKLTDTSTVRVDMALERTTINQQTAAVSIDSDYFEIRGRCHLEISSGTATLEWEERWL